MLGAAYSNLSFAGEVIPHQEYIKYIIFPPLSQDVMEIFYHFVREVKCVILCHKISMASPKLKKRYRSLIASS